MTRAVTVWTTHPVRLGALLWGIAAVACGGYVDPQERLAPREAGSTPSSAGTADTAASFSGDILPLLINYCGNCHDAASRVGDVDVTSYTGAAAVLTAGDADASRLVTSIEDGSMPPPGGSRPTPAQVALIRAWIEGGASDG